MPVRKFRSIEDMKRQTLWREPGDPALYRAIRALWELGRRTGANRFPHGVYRHRSIEEMNRLTDQWKEDNFRDHQRRRSAAAVPPRS